MSHPHPIPTSPELAALLKSARDIVDAMTPEQRAEMERAQLRSWNVGEHMLRYPNCSRADAEALIDRAIAEAERT